MQASGDASVAPAPHQSAPSSPPSPWPALLSALAAALLGCSFVLVTPELAGGAPLPWALPAVGGGLCFIAARHPVLAGGTTVHPR